MIGPGRPQRFAASLTTMVWFLSLLFRPSHAQQQQDGGGAIAIHDTTKDEPDTSWNPFHHHKKTVNDLQKEFPNVDIVDLQRFHKAFGGGNQASQKLQDYLDWKSQRTFVNTGDGDGDDDDDDASIWKSAITQSYNAYNSNTENSQQHGNLRGSTSTSTSPEVEGQVPEQLQQVLYDHNIVDKSNQHRIFQLFPERMELMTNGNSHKVYADAMAVYMETKFQQDQNLHEGVTVAIDVRPGRGWPNPRTTSILQTVKELSKVVNALHPERVHQIWVYPIPGFADTVWRVIKNFLPSSIKNSVKLIPGDGIGLHGTLPKDKMLQYIDESTFDKLESHRRQIALGET